MKCQKCGNELKEQKDYVYVIPDIGLTVANLSAFVCKNPECDYVELSAESVDAIEVAEARWRAMLPEKERAKVGIF